MVSIGVEALVTPPIGIALDILWPLCSTIPYVHINGIALRVNKVCVSLDPMKVSSMLGLK